MRARPGHGSAHRIGSGRPAQELTRNVVRTYTTIHTSPAASPNYSPPLIWDSHQGRHRLTDTRGIAFQDVGSLVLCQENRAASSSHSKRPFCLEVDRPRGFGPNAPSVFFRGGSVSSILTSTLKYVVGISTGRSRRVTTLLFTYFILGCRCLSPNC